MDGCVLTCCASNITTTTRSHSFPVYATGDSILPKRECTTCPSPSDRRVSRFPARQRLRPCTSVLVDDGNGFLSAPKECSYSCSLSEPILQMSRRDQVGGMHPLDSPGLETIFGERVTKVALFGNPDTRNQVDCSDHNTCCVGNSTVFVWWMCVWADLKLCWLCTIFVDTVTVFLSLCVCGLSIYGLDCA